MIGIVSSLKLHNKHSTDIWQTDWSGDGPPGQGFDGNLYSWIAYAGSKGYTTLSIDRLCNGNEHNHVSFIKSIYRLTIIQVFQITLIQFQCAK